MADDDGFLTIPEACHTLGRSERTIRRYLSQGRLSNQYRWSTFGKVTIIPRAEVEALAREMTEVAAGSMTDPSATSDTLPARVREAPAELVELRKVLEALTDTLKNSPAMTMTRKRASWPEVVGYAVFAVCSLVATATLCALVWEHLLK